MATMPSATAPSGGVSPFGQRLRRWRALRGMSQLALASAAGTTGRHLSFLETGRSRPGPDLVLRLAEVLAVPLPDRNDLLVAAGLPAQFEQHDLGSAELAAVDQVLDLVLGRHEPYPAWVVRRPFTFVRANRGAQALFPELTALTPEQLVDLWFGPGPFRDGVQNWADVAHAGVAALTQDAAVTDDPEAVALLVRARAHVDRADLGNRARRRPSDPDKRAPFSAVVCPVFALQGRTVRTISAVMRFDSAVEITTSQLRVELMFPADPDSAEVMRTLTRTNS
jgi:transcriptional regulator with XRE-family HTH domain